jgi:hypothetical protein
MHVVIIQASDLGNDWRAEAHIRVDGLPLLVHRRLLQIRKAREQYMEQIRKWDDEEKEILNGRLSDANP